MEQPLVVDVLPVCVFHQCGAQKTRTIITRCMYVRFFFNNIFVYFREAKPYVIVCVCVDWFVERNEHLSGLILRMQAECDVMCLFALFRVVGDVRVGWELFWRWCMEHG